jgi:hypothetical protein
MPIPNPSDLAKPNARPLISLYEEDETAWLEAMARLAADRDVEAMDLDHLAEYLNDMAERDRREVLHRLSTLLMHLLKWEHQSERRSRSWERTIAQQRLKLGDLLESGTLRNHAQAILDDAYRRAVKLAAIETGLDEGTFPESCPFSWETIVGES